MKKDTIEEISWNQSSIIDYIQKHREEIESIERLNFEISLSDSGEKPIIKGFDQVVHCEMEYDDTVYLLENGSWQYLNDSFLELVNTKLDNINNFVDYSCDFNQLYKNLEGNSEDEFIEKACEKSEYIKLHKRMINKNNLKVEVADLYSDKSSELYAVKRGTETSKSIYSISQSTLGIQALSNHKYFYVREELSKYNNKDKYSERNYEYINDNKINNIIKCKQFNILWLIEEDDANYIKKGVRDQTFKLSQFGSIMLKLQIINFYDFAKTHEFDSKIYFAIRS